jgi:hypothetical protein
MTNATSKQTNSVRIDLRISHSPISKVVSFMAKFGPCRKAYVNHAHPRNQTNAAI